MIEERTGRKVLVHTEPDTLSAYGAALFARDTARAV